MYLNMTKVYEYNSFKPNAKSNRYVSSSQICVDDNENESPSPDFRFDFDSHANMPVVGKGAYILNYIGRSAEVSTYSPEYEPHQFPVVDAAVQYDCSYQMKSYILIIPNALYVSSMNNHLMPPFILREAGIEVNNTPNIQIDNPDLTDHSIFFSESDLRTHLSL